MVARRGRAPAPVATKADGWRLAEAEANAELATLPATAAGHSAILATGSERATKTDPQELYHVDAATSA